MDEQTLWSKFQSHMGYTDEEMVLFKSDPEKVKMVTGTKDFVKTKIVAEVVESHGCHAGHRVGDRIVMDGNGQMLSDECPNKMCIFAVSALHAPVDEVFERFTAGTDPGRDQSTTVQCSDVGLENGGWGQVSMKVFVEDL